MTNIAQQLTVFLNSLEANSIYALLILLVLWGIHIINFIVGYRLNYLGIIPRHIIGIPGIIFFSFLHGDLNHLFFNSIPLFVLLCFLLTFGVPFAVLVSVTIIILSGLLIWLFGRNAIHIGASSLIMGYLGFFLFQAFTEVALNTILIGFVCIYYFGGLIFSIFPSEEKVSWEGHLFGLAAGLATAYFIWQGTIQI